MTCKGLIIGIGNVDKPKRIGHISQEKTTQDPYADEDIHKIS